MIVNVQGLSLIHYGHDVFDVNKFQPVTNRPHGWVKPEGGLWASPIDSEFGWRQWCDIEEFAQDAFGRSFTFALSGRVWRIDGVQDLNDFQWVRHAGFEFGPDFEAVLKAGVQAVWLTVDGQLDTRFSMPRSLYGWDCESVVVLDKMAVHAWE